MTYFLGKFLNPIITYFFETEGVLPLVQKLISDQYDTSRKGLNYYSNNSFFIDVLSSVDGFNLSSLNFSLSFLSMYDDSIFVAILHIQKLYISPSLDCSAVSYSI